MQMGTISCCGITTGETGIGVRGDFLDVDNLLFVVAVT